MDRRDFLIKAIASGALYTAGGLPELSDSAHAQFGTPDGPILVNVTLLGGPDFRHLLPAPYTSSSSSYGYRFWRARAAAFGIASSPSAWQKHWNEKYYHRSSGGTQFGILKSASWLRNMWDDGNVAIVNNVIGSRSRDHEHSIMVMDQGNRSIGPTDFVGSGWGGRLAQAAGGNVISATPTPRTFCFGVHPSGAANRVDSSIVVGADDTRELGLYEARINANAPRWDENGKVSRSLKSYYRGLRQDMDEDSVYAEFVELEKKVRQFGKQITARLRDVPEPATLRNLAHWERSPMKFPGFGLQARNIHDALACSDILKARVMSMEMGDWDSHEGQARQIEPNYRDLFGGGRSFHAMWNALPNNVKNRLVFCFQGEFGRQLLANGENGTDHGRGNSVLLIGKPVRGGIYGDMFPDNETGRFGAISADIRGETAIDHVYGELCDWVSPGSGDTVFPSRVNAKIEDGIRLDRLFT